MQKVTVHCHEKFGTDKLSGAEHSFRTAGSTRNDRNIKSFAVMAFIGLANAGQSIPMSSMGSPLNLKLWYWPIEPISSFNPCGSFHIPIPLRPTFTSIH